MKDTFADKDLDMIYVLMILSNGNLNNIYGPINTS
jgi:hypothetical protein